MTDPRTPAPSNLAAVVAAAARAGDPSDPETLRTAARDARIEEVSRALHKAYLAVADAANEWEVDPDGAGSRATLCVAVRRWRAAHEALQLATEQPGERLRESRPTRMRVYLAGPSAELPRVLDAMTLITAAGYSITEHWWARIQEASNNGWTHDSQVPDEYMRESARRNRRGIEMADVVIVLARESGGYSSGAAGEIGYALALRDVERSVEHHKKVILVGDCKGYVWSWLADACVGSVRDAIALLDPRIDQ